MVKLAAKTRVTREEFAFHVDLPDPPEGYVFIAKVHSDGEPYLMMAPNENQSGPYVIGGLAMTSHSISVAELQVFAEAATLFAAAVEKWKVERC